MTNKTHGQPAKRRESPLNIGRAERRPSALLVPVVISVCLLVACGTLEKRAVLITPGDGKEQVLAAMGGPPDDRQLKGDNEAWQYCQTGAGFGYHDYRVIWFKAGRVVGINSYKSARPGTSCVAAIQPIKWEDAPDATIEVRHR